MTHKRDIRPGVPERVRGSRIGKFSEGQRRNYDFKILQLKRETVTDRHIAASLGSVGLTFVSDIDRFMEYLEAKGEFTLLKIIKEDRNLSQEELRQVRKEFKGIKVPRYVDFINNWKP